jgi:hypothetical protein
LVPLLAASVALARLCGAALLLLEVSLLVVDPVSDELTDVRLVPDERLLLGGGAVLGGDLLAAAALRDVAVVLVVVLAPGEYAALAGGIVRCGSVGRLRAARLLRVSDDDGCSGGSRRRLHAVGRAAATALAANPAAPAHDGARFRLTPTLTGVARATRPRPLPVAAAV